MDVGFRKPGSAKLSGQVVGHGGHLAQTHRSLEGDDALEDLARLELLRSQARRGALRDTGVGEQERGEAAGKCLDHGLLLTLVAGEPTGSVPEKRGCRAGTPRTPLRSADADPRKQWPGAQTA